MNQKHSSVKIQKVEIWIIKVISVYVLGIITHYNDNMWLTMLEFFADRAGN